MTPDELANPVVASLVAAINGGDRKGFLALLSPDAILTDDAAPHDVCDWIDRELFAAHAHMTVDREQGHGLYLLARMRNDLWAEMSTFWRFQLSDGKVSRIDTGHA
jgi:hypothetical protein